MGRQQAISAVFPDARVLSACPPWDDVTVHTLSKTGRAHDDKKYAAHVEEMQCSSVLPGVAGSAQRQRRAASARASTDNIVCPIFLDADVHFFQKWKGQSLLAEPGEGEAALTTEELAEETQEQIMNVLYKMVDVIHEADGKPKRRGEERRGGVAAAAASSSSGGEGDGG